MVCRGCTQVGCSDSAAPTPQLDKQAIGAQSRPAEMVAGRCNPWQAKDVVVKITRLDFG